MGAAFLLALTPLRRTAADAGAGRRNLGRERLDQAKRSQVMFMDREDIVNIFVVTNVALPAAALPVRPRS